MFVIKPCVINLGRSEGLAQNADNGSLIQIFSLVVEDKRSALQTDVSDFLLEEGGNRDGGCHEEHEQSGCKYHSKDN